jgi:hypothetical protein
MRISIPLLLTTALALAIISCATSPPIQRESGFSPDQMDKVYVLPVIDDRVNTAIKIDINKKVDGITRHNLEGKRYTVEFMTDPSAVAGISGEDLKAGNAEVFAKLGPPDAKWVIVFVLEELSTRLTFGSTGNAEITMIIVDRQNKRVVWRDKGVGHAGQASLVGMAMIGMMGEAALDEALKQIFQKIPARNAH